jgi:uncharacterized protein involved in tolerance to divalent cations
MVKVKTSHFHQLKLTIFNNNNYNTDKIIHMLMNNIRKALKN